jgi:hypothetical protein
VKGCQIGDASHVLIDFALFSGASPRGWRQCGYNTTMLCRHQWRIIPLFVLRARGECFEQSSPPMTILTVS